MHDKYGKTLEVGDAVLIDAATEYAILPSWKGEDPGGRMHAGTIQAIGSYDSFVPGHTEPAPCISCGSREFADVLLEDGPGCFSGCVLTKLDGDFADAEAVEEATCKQ